jgi:SAM-dependent methyltransferase
MYLRIPMSPERRHRMALAIKRWSGKASGTASGDEAPGARDGMLPPEGPLTSRTAIVQTQLSPSPNEKQVAESRRSGEPESNTPEARVPKLEEQLLRAQVASTPPRDSFALEPDSGYRIRPSSDRVPVERWESPLHLRRYRPALFLSAGDSLLLPPLRTASESVLRLRFADGGDLAPEGSLAIEVDIVDMAGNSRSLMRASVHSIPRIGEPEIQTALISLPACSSEAIVLRLRCLADPERGAAVGSVVLLELVAGQAGEIDLVAARAFRALRIASEMRHFSQAYDHPMYVARRARTALGIDALIPSERSFAIPGAVENAFDYALSSLCRSLKHTAPDFERRLRDLASEHGRLSILSVGTGQGLVEAALFRSVQLPIELTIIDVNEDLLDRAAGVMPANTVIARRIVADANALPHLPGGFDIAMCVSGVHHLVELGAFFAAVRDVLKESGELWLIGEQIGPAGNRLDPSALARANQLFSSLPERLRRNYYTGQIDTRLDNPDQSDSTFEGIRSDAIESEIARFFVPVHVSRRDCILWRMVWPEYVDNYSLQRKDDVEILDWLVEQELDYYLAGGRPTELHGVYAPIRRSAGFG